MHRNFTIIAAVLGFLGVAFGAFGTHGLAAVFEANGRAATFDTAAQYQMYHALALLAVAWMESRMLSRLTRWSGCLFITGSILFCGSLYILAIFDVRIMGAVAPLGGAAFLGGWALLGLAAWRGEETYQKG
jgi:uncharacterized membrane protein YgdD (TMEM256/DUF423 family)